jgi:hypothetical protein
MQLHITTLECEELLAIVDERTGELSSEIHHAATSTYRDRLRARKARLLVLHKKLEDLQKRREMIDELLIHG